MSEGGWVISRTPPTFLSPEFEALQLVLLAQVAASIEANIDVGTWRDGASYESSDSKAAARWFRYLASTGFELSEIEQYVADKVRPRPREAPRTRTGQPRTKLPTTRRISRLPASTPQPEPVPN